MRHVRFLLMIAIAAVAGAVAGRVAAEVRRQQETGDPIDLSLNDVRIRAQDIVPGLVAAARVRDTPWSWLHIPSWLAAFGVNLGVGAVGGDLSRIREMAERAAFSLAGIEIDDDDDRDGFGDFDDFGGPGGDGMDGYDGFEGFEAGAADAPPAAAPGAPGDAPGDAPSDAPSDTPRASDGGGSVTWTAPGPSERRDTPAGFSAFNE